MSIWSALDKYVNRDVRGALRDADDAGLVWGKDAARSISDFGEDVVEGAGDVVDELTGKAAEERANKRTDKFVDQMLADLGAPDLLYETSVGAAAADPAAIAAQRQALEQLQQAASGEYTDADRARQQMMMMQERTAERGQREAIQQQMQARGLGGSGTSLQAQLVGQQGAANRANMRGLGLEDMAQRRALQAMQAAGTLSGQMRGQSFGEETTRRGAHDEAKKFNVSNRRGDLKDAAALRLGQYNSAANRQQQQQGSFISGVADILL